MRERGGPSVSVRQEKDEKKDSKGCRFRDLGVHATRKPFNRPVPLREGGSQRKTAPWREGGAGVFPGTESRGNSTSKNLADGRKKLGAHTVYQQDQTAQVNLDRNPGLKSRG